MVDMIPLWGVVATIVFGIWKLSKAQREKLDWDRYGRKASIYANILSSVDGFYEDTQDPQKKVEFLEALRLGELYAPDAVIRAGNTFLERVAVGSAASQEQKEQALALFRLGLRRDLQPKTRLSIKDFRIWGSR